MSVPIYEYKPLPTNHNNTIRLLRVQDELVNGLISCDLRVATTEDQHTCLSYTWGSEEYEQEILINGESFYVRQNLWTFLRMMRCNHTDVEIWIDAICINQNNAAERAAQVQIMKDIYSSSQSTFIWLGDALESDTSPEQRSSDMESDLKLVDITTWMQRFDDEVVKYGYIAHDASKQEQEIFLLGFSADIVNDDILATVWYVVSRIWAHVYFTRLWVVQENYYSSKVVLTVGKIVLDVNVLLPLLDFIETMRSMSHRFDKNQPPLPVTDLEASEIPELDGFYPEGDYYRSLLNLQPSTLQSSQKAQLARLARLKRVSSELLSSACDDHLSEFCITQSILQKELPCLPNEQVNAPVMLSIYGNCKCSEPLDKVYALSGLFSFHVVIDYTITKLELYFRLCESYTPDGRDWEMAELLPKILKITLLDFLMTPTCYPGRTMLKTVKHESEVDHLTYLEPSIMLRYERTVELRYPITRTHIPGFFVCGFCEHCSRTVNFTCSTSDPDVDEHILMDNVIMQCFRTSHVIFILRRYGWCVDAPEYKALCAAEATLDCTQLEPPIPDPRFWASHEKLHIPLSWSSTMKGVLILHCEMPEDMFYSYDENSDDSLVDQIISRRTECPDFAATKKISRVTLERLKLSPEQVDWVIQRLDEESYFD